MTYKSMRPKYSEDKSEKSTEKNRQKLFLILSIISFVSVGILTPFYVTPPHLEQRIFLVGLIISTVIGIIFSLMTVHENLKEKEFNSIGNLLLGLFLLYFFFFGYVCNVYDKNPGDNLLFIFKSFFDPYVKTDIQEYVNLFVVGTGHVEYLKFELKYPISLGLLIFIGIGTLQGYRENFLVYSIKRNLWTIPFVILLSIIWHGINFQVDFYYALGEYFASGLGYLNLIILELIFVGSGIFGGFLKSLRFNRLKQQHQELFLTDTNLREMK